MKEKILKFYYLNMISFKCSPLLFKHKRILRTVFSMTFSKISGVILLISSMMLFFNYKQMIQEYLLPQLEDLYMPEFVVPTRWGDTKHSKRNHGNTESCLSWFFNFTFWCQYLFLPCKWNLHYCYLNYTIHLSYILDLFALTLKYFICVYVYSIYVCTCVKPEVLVKVPSVSPHVWQTNLY